MDYSLTVAFWALSLSLVMTPGADWAYAITAGTRNFSIAPAISGMLLGYTAITLVVAAGVGALVTSVPHVLTGMTILGAGYLFWLGLQCFLKPSAPAMDESKADTWFGQLCRGFGISGLNPKGILLFFAILPQFTSTKGAWPVASQITILGILHVINCAVIYSFVAQGARLVLQSRPDVAQRVSQVSGIAMMLIATILLFEEFVPSF
jgi:threonine/homoserine/homoserine lactone efflux protein